MTQHNIDELEAILDSFYLYSIEKPTFSEREFYVVAKKILQKEKKRDEQDRQELISLRLLKIELHEVCKLALVDLQHSEKENGYQNFKSSQKLVDIIEKTS